MNRVKLTIAAGTFAVALFGAAGANADPYYYYGYGAYVPGYYGYYYPYSYAPVYEYAPVAGYYYAPTCPSPYGYWRAC